MDRQTANSQTFVQKLTEIIETNLKNEQFGVSELAREMGISRSNLYTKVKRITKKSVSRFISEVRLTKAMELLRQTSLTVSEVAYEVGFGSPTYFTKCFHDYYGIPPGEVSEYEESDSEIEPTPQQDIDILKRRKKTKLLFAATTLIILVIISFIVVKPLSFTKANTEKSIAVLPLQNLTGQTENDYLVDGIHDALIGELGRIESLRVISRTSTLRYRDSNMLLKDIANELGVNTIMEGAVIGAGDSLRMLIQLIDVFPKERHILSNEYRDGISHILTLQSEVVKDIAKKTDLKLSKKEEQQLNRARKINPETYKAYLRGMYYVNQGTKKSFEKGINYLNEAIKKDPGDPFAYAGLALGYAIQGHGQLESEESFLRAMSAANKAIKLDPTIDEAYTALALLYLYDLWDWPKAKEAFESALANNPNNAIANAHYAWYYVLFSDFETSIYYGKKAVMIEPLSASYNAWLALLYVHMKEYDLAENYARKALSINEDTPYAYFALGKICIIKGQYQQAIEYQEKLPQKGFYYKVMRGYAYVKAGQREKAMELWNEVENYAKNHRVNCCYRGMMAAYLGFTDKAFELLNEAIDRKDFPVIYINTYVFIESIRNDPRFDQLLARMNLLTGKSSLTAHH
jgi:TolB-like protein/AraC-like DNA-binding protein/Tfp pilus assembly protein PilF